MYNMESWEDPAPRSGEGERLDLLLRDMSQKPELFEDCGYLDKSRAVSQIGETTIVDPYSIIGTLEEHCLANIRDAESRDKQVKYFRKLELVEQAMDQTGYEADSMERFRGIIRDASI